VREGEGLDVQGVGGGILELNEEGLVEEAGVREDEVEHELLALGSVLACTATGQVGEHPLEHLLRHVDGPLRHVLAREVQEQIHIDSLPQPRAAKHSAHDTTHTHKAQ
jgi:hypothetical protein